jgi:ubiquitin-conjugating enzyme E2 Z
MNEKPYHNEPGFEQERTVGDARKYNDIIRHETIRVAVCEMLEGTTPCPESLREVMIKSFQEGYSHYETTCNNNMMLQGQRMSDPFGERKGSFDYKSILTRLEALRVKYVDDATNQNNSNNDETDGSDSEPMSEDS